MTVFQIASHDEFYDRIKQHRIDETKHIKYLKRHQFWMNRVVTSPSITMIFSSIMEEIPTAWYSEDGEGIETVMAETPIAAAEIWEENGKWTLCHLAVRNDYQNQGIGTEMIHAIVDFLVQRNIKTLYRTRPSADGEKYTKDKLTNALSKAGIQSLQNCG